MTGEATVRSDQPIADLPATESVRVMMTRGTGVGAREPGAR